MENRVVIKEIKIDSLNERKRKIRIILPLGYGENGKRYPVMYMHDGQNLVDKSYYSGSSWEVMRTMDVFHEKGYDMIIVGIDCDDTKRMLEYSAFLSPRLNRIMIKAGQLPADEIRPEADMYGDFIVHQLKTLIDKEYLTLPDRKNTFIAGSSCGGNISIYLGIKHQDVFSVIGAFSPAYWCVRKGINDYLNKIEMKFPIRIYHDMGTKESGLSSYLNLQHQREFHKLILSKIGSENVMMKVGKGALHNEFAWAERYPDFYEYCFQK